MGFKKARLCDCEALAAWLQIAEERLVDMAQFTYTPHGVCSAKIDFELEDGIVKNIRFTRGCNGNTQGIARLAEGMPVDEVIRRLKGTDCGGKGTSCPDQLAIALELAKEEE